MTSDFLDEAYRFAAEMGDRVGDRLMEYFGTVGSTEKADGSLITQADEWADRTLREAIAARFPDCGVLTEEGNRVLPEKEWCWAIDPLDGTTNFARNIPLWGVSIGLLYRGTPVFGYLRFPPVRQSFHGFFAGDLGLDGELNCSNGAFLNGKPIHPTADTPAANHIFSLCSRSICLAPQIRDRKIRMLGVASYNILSIACGIAFGGVEATPKIWDIAAAWPIVRAAGAVWVPLADEPFPATLGGDYAERSFPSLLLASESLLPQFLPIAKTLLEKI